MDSNETTKLDELNYHELLDRAHCLTEIFYATILKHPLIDADSGEADEELKEAANELFAAIGAFYQLVGSKQPD